MASFIKQAQLDDILARGCIRKLTPDEVSKYSGPVHYPSHHVVLRPDKPSTPCRLVISPLVLNEFLLKGPDLLNSIIGVMIKWRENQYAVIGDVSKMFNQVLTDSNTDAHVQRILWRISEVRRPDVYVCLVVMIGIKPAPAVANTAMDLTAEQCTSIFPEASEVIKESRYMDDVVDSRNSIDELRQITKDIDTVLATGNFRIKEWISNVSLSEDNSNNQNSSEVSKVTPLVSECIDKVLGLVWNRSSDTISLSIKIPKEFQSDSNNKWCIPDSLTPRQILSAVNSIYDVFGIADPFKRRANVAMENLCKDK